MKQLLIFFISLVSLLQLHAQCPAVSSPQVMTLGTTNVTISYTASSGNIPTYMIRFWKTATPAATSTVSSPATYQTLTGLSASTQYSYRIITYCGTPSVVGDSTSVFTFTTLANSGGYTPQAAYGYQFNRIKVNNDLGIPQRTVEGITTTDNGAQIYGMSDTLVMYNPITGKHVKFRPNDSTNIAIASNKIGNNVTVNLSNGSSTTFNTNDTRGLGGDLNGTLPNPTVNWANGLSTYDGRYVSRDTLNKVRDSLQSNIDTKVNKIDSVPGGYYPYSSNPLDYKSWPRSNNLTIVGLGSSVLFGQGATNNQGWFYKLSAALAIKGYTLINKGVPGNNTVAAINRFYTDVVSLHPDACIIGLSLQNEGITGSNKDSVYAQFKENIYKLVDMCRKAGIKPIVTGCYPGNNYTSVEYNYCKNFNDEMEASDIPFIQFMESVDDGAGHWREGMYTDALHPNDVGHEAMYRAIPLGLFDKIYNSNQHRAFTMLDKGYTNFGADQTTTSAINAPTISLGSFTASVWFQRTPGAAAGKTILAFNNGTSDPFRVRNPIDSLVLDNSATANFIASTVKTSDYKWHNVIVTYDYYSDTIRLYIDGVIYGKGLPGSQLGTVTSITVGGRADQAIANAVGYNFKDFSLYRVALSKQDMDKMRNGFYKKGSAEIIASMSDKEITNTRKFVNYALSTSILQATTPVITAAVGVVAPAFGETLESVAGRDSVTTHGIQARSFTASSGSISMSMLPSTNSAVLGSFTNSALSFFTNALERARIDSIGRIGINTTSPAATLHVNGTVRFDIGSDAVGDIWYRGSGGNMARLAPGSNGQYLKISAGLPTYSSLTSSDVTSALGYTPYNPATNPVIAGGETLQSVTTRGATTTTTILANAGITSTSAESFRTINDGGYISFFNSANTIRKGYIQGGNDNNMHVRAETGNLFLGNLSTDTVVVVNSSGNVGINTTSPTDRLTVNGNITATNATVKSLHFTGMGGAPTYALGPSSVVGTGASVTIAGTDAAFTITLNTGTGVSSNGTILNITTTADFPTAPVPVFSNANSSTIGTTVYMAGTGQHSITMSNTTALASSTTYIWNVILIGR